MFVQSKAGANQRSLVRFTLPTLPAGCTVSAATLNVHNQSPVAGRTIDVYRAASTWAEGTVTWGTQPATAGTAVGSTTTATAGLQTWNLLTQVKAQYSGTNDGFIMRDRTEGDAVGPQQSYRTREAGTTPPELVVNWS